MTTWPGCGSSATRTSSSRTGRCSPAGVLRWLRAFGGCRFIAVALRGRFGWYIWFGFDRPGVAPAIADGALFLRTGERLYCIGPKK
jgi:hypothetical protein